MARYMIFEKTKDFNYKFKGSYSGTTGGAAIKSAKARGASISPNRIYIAIPNTQFMKHQYNPKQIKNKGQAGVSTQWKKAK